MSKVGRKPDEAFPRHRLEIGHWADLWRACLLVALTLFGCARPAITPASSVGVAPSVESNQPQPSSSSLPVSAQDIRWGSPNAPVTIVAFLDFECPFCAQVHATVTELLDEYGPTKLRLIVKHAPLPFHQKGIPAARATQAVYELAGPDAFLAYVTRIFEYPEALGDATLLAWASELGLAPADFQKAIASEALQAKVKADLALAEAVGVSGVPAFYINGAAIVGARPKADFVTIVEHEVRAGEELARRGVAADAVFAERVAVNWVAQAAEPKPYEEIAYRVPIGNSPVLGPKAAAITIVEFADFECPFCQQAHQTVAALMTKYPNQIRWVMKHNPLPFHPLAVPAAITALNVRKRGGDAAYWQALNRLYAAPKLSPELLSDLAREFGVTDEAPVATGNDSELPTELRDDQDLAMDLNAMGTPHFFINGRRLAGAQPIDVFEEVVQQELQKISTLGSVQEPYEVLQQAALPPEALNKRPVPPPPPSAPTLGDANAQVAIQMFADFECGYCARVVPTLAALRARYPGKIKLVWRHLPLPFHKQAKLAAAAALEAEAQLGGQGFWRMAERLMGVPGAFVGDGGAAVPKPHDLNRPAVLAAARDLGLDEPRFTRALDEGIHDPAIEADERVAQSLGVHGTPGFFVGSYALDGAQPLARFDRLVRLVLEEAKQN